MRTTTRPYQRGRSVALGILLVLVRRARLTIRSCAVRLRDVTSLRPVVACRPSAWQSRCMCRGAGAI